MDEMRWSEPLNDEERGPPTIKNHSVTNFNGTLYCFGGYDGRRNHQTLLLYSIKDQIWQPTIQAEDDRTASIMRRSSSRGGGGGGGGANQDVVVVTGIPPAGRNGHTATLATDDEEHGRILILGGWLGQGPLAASDLHCLSIAPNNELRWYQPPVKGTPPGPCNMHSADFSASQREVYVFRGGNGREYLNDLHALHVDTYTWRRVETNGTPPQQRANHSSALLEETNELFIFGGWNGRERLNDIFILDIETSTWTCPQVGGVLPHPRAGMTLTAMNGRLFLFGGSGTSSKCFQDLQILDREKMAWLDVMQQHETTAATSASICAGSSTNNSNKNSGSSGGSGGRASSSRSSNYYDPDHHHHMVDSLDYHHHPSLHQQMGRVSLRGADWRSRDILLASATTASSSQATANPNDEDTLPSILIQGSGPGRRAGHTATAVRRKLYVFGGSCGSDYLNDFHVLDSDPPPLARVQEPTSLQLLERRLRHFFNEEEFSDVTFIVEEQKVYGHKLILSLVSDCFRAMFTTASGFRESASNATIEIPNCSHAAFLSMMEYIYTGRIVVLQPRQILQQQQRLLMTTTTTTATSSSQGHHTAAADSTTSSSTRLNPTATAHHQQQEDDPITHIVDLLELADQFMLDHLKQKCESMLASFVDSETVEYLYQVSLKTNSGQLLSICEHYIRNQTATTTSSNNNNMMGVVALTPNQQHPLPHQQEQGQQQDGS